MTAKIEKLTPEQEAMLPIIRDKFIKIGLCCDPANRPEAEDGVRMAYEAAKLPPPKSFLWFRSPLEGATEVAKMVAKEDKDTKKKLSDRVKEQIQSAIWGQHDAGWLSFYNFFGEVVGLECVKRLDGLTKVAMNAGWWWAFDTVAVLTERPVELHRDEQNRLHNETGPAIAYPDGFAVYAIHGVRLPKKVIMNPQDLTLKEINSEKNAEIKRIMRERFGEGRFLAESKASVTEVDMVSTDTGEQPQTIMRALMKDSEGRQFLVGSDGSTNRTYYMETSGDAKTCKDAHNFVAGLDESRLEIQS